jgi:formylglycine-generating enzyme required for sulfatase activity
MDTTEQQNLAHLGNSEIDCVFELGQKTISLGEARALMVGSVVALNNLVAEPLVLRMNGVVLACAETVVIHDRMMARITRMADVPDRVPRSQTASQAEPTPDPAASATLQPLSRTDLRQHMIHIPEGCFTMGGGAAPDQSPARVVHLSSFLISRYPVTNQDYREFVNDTSHPCPLHWRQGTYAPGKSRHPVVHVSWHHATAYAEWLGARLPTEAEWEKAARGTDQRRYPWGNRFVDQDRCNCLDQIGDTLHVDRFSLGRSPYGVWDMAGNVSEWCQDYYHADAYQQGPDKDPPGPDGGSHRVIRGGFFSDSKENLCTTHRRSAPSEHMDDNVGFRVAGAC